MNTKRFFIPLLIVLAISFFFRFYNFRQFHYWSGDEEVLTATIRHIIWDRSPTLIVQNANLGFGLGPFYHYLLTPFYYIFNFDLVSLQAIASVLGVFTTFLVYLGGKELGGKKMGLLAGFLYASSFFISLFDRRLVHLTLDPVMTALTFYLLVKTVKGNKQYIPLLAIPIGFSFHVDASLIVLVFTIIVSLLYFKIPLRNKYGAVFLIILGIFLSPLVLAEIRYHGAVIQPMKISLSRRLVSTRNSAGGFKSYSPIEFTDVLGRVIFTGPSNFIEEHFFYTRNNPRPLYTPLPQIIVIFTFIIGLFLFLKKNPNRNKPETVLWITTFSFILSIFLYSQVLKNNFYQHYYMIFFPIFILIFAEGIFLLYKNFKPVFYSFLILYFFVNIFTLLNSSMKYPLYRKIALVKESLATIGNNKFSIHASADGYVHGGGWTELYVLTRHIPVKSYWYDYWGWIYAAYSLYPGPVQQEDPETIVSIHKTGDKTDVSGKLLSRNRFRDIEIDVLANLKTK